MNRRVFLAGGVAAVAAPIPALPAHNELHEIEDLYDAWYAAKVKLEHLCYFLERDEGLFSDAWDVANATETSARLAVLQHRDQTIEAVRLRARFINIMVERDHVCTDFGDFTEEMSIMVKSLV